MKILNAIDVGTWSMKIDCKCGAVLEVVAEDFSLSGNLKSELNVYITCPRCRHIEYVEDAPTIVWDTVRQRKQR